MIKPEVAPAPSNRPPGEGHKFGVLPLTPALSREDRGRGRRARRFGLISRHDARLKHCDVRGFSMPASTAPSSESLSATLSTSLDKVSDEVSDQETKALAQ